MFGYGRFISYFCCCAIVTCRLVFFRKRCVTTDERLDFLKELVADVPELQGDFDDVGANQNAAVGGGGSGLAEGSSSGGGSAGGRKRVSVGGTAAADDGGRRPKRSRVKSGNVTTLQCIWHRVCNFYAAREFQAAGHSQEVH